MVCLSGWVVCLGGWVVCLGKWVSFSSVRVVGGDFGCGSGVFGVLVWGGLVEFLC